MVAVYPQQCGSAGKYGTGGVPFQALVIVAQISHKEVSFPAFLPWSPVFQGRRRGTSGMWKGFRNVGAFGIGDPHPKADHLTTSIRGFCIHSCRMEGRPGSRVDLVLSTFPPSPKTCWPKNQASYMSTEPQHPCPLPCVCRRHPHLPRHSDQAC